jgi:hypothetical protein
MKRWIPQPDIKEKTTVYAPMLTGSPNLPPPPMRTWSVNTMGTDQNVKAHHMDIGPGGTLLFLVDGQIDLAFSAHRWVDVCVVED